VRRFGYALLGLVLLFSCSPSATTTGPSGAAVPEGMGGTLRLGLAGSLNLDPQKSYASQMHASELFRCCLLRTLLSYNGLSAADGGGIAQPDLAERMPEISQDRLTWTFTLRPGLTYAPPYDDVPIVARDVIRALEREGRLGGIGYAFYYDVIDGFTEFAAREADSIRGLLAPDDRTLVVQLTRPTGDFGDRIAQAAAAPIPPGLDDPRAESGAAEGHDHDFGSYLVASGPYMPAVTPLFGEVRHSPRRGVTLPPGTTVTLERNPSWSRSSDPLRPAVADRIEIRFFASQAELEEAIRGGDVDLEIGLYSSSPAAIAEAEADDALHLRAYSGSSQDVIFATLNVAVPPLDDLSVRRAVNLVVDRERIGDIIRTVAPWPGVPPLRGAPATHFVTDALEGDLLSAYDPYVTQGRADAISAARAEMARSRYDTDHDGVCDAEVCQGLAALTYPVPTFEQIATTLREDLLSIGIGLELPVLSLKAALTASMDPGNRFGLAFVSWAPDYANASTFFLPLLHHPTDVPNRDLSLLGATREQLRRWGYEVRDVPTVASRIEACDRIIGEAQVRCWALLDRYVMERVVPIVPLFASVRTIVVATRVTGVVFDAGAAGQVALDRLSVRS
jgi:peptide/nickel transport system substrate-binding protein